MPNSYNIVMFAHNESDNIAHSITSVFNNTSEDLNGFHIIANGCTDDTVKRANDIKQSLGFTKLHITELNIGDKCNAWNHYIANDDGTAVTHFFVDADVKFSDNCFDQLHQKLVSSPEETVAIAGMPISGRNKDFYRDLVIERSCIFGNLYGLKKQFLLRIKEDDFTLPVGLNWIDSFITKAINTDLKFFNYNLPNRVTYIEGVGYYFDSLNPLKYKDIKLYINRIGRYELGKIQERYLDRIAVQEWPRELFTMNAQIAQNIDQETAELGIIKTYLVKRRLKKLAKQKNKK